MTFERYTPDAVNRALAVRESCGGKAANVARALVTLGETALVSGFIGGEHGMLAERHLRACGVQTDFVTVTAPTRLCITLIDRATATATELVEEPAAVEAEAWQRLRDKFASLLPRCRAIVLSGSLPPNAPEQFYAECVRLATEAAVPAVVDARGEPLKHVLPLRPLVVKPNRAELEATLGVQIDTEAALRGAVAALVHRGPRWAVVSMGSAGAIVSDGRLFWRVQPPRVTVVSAVGSGDALAAGLAAGIVRKLPMLDAAVLAVACGAANVLTPTPGQINVCDLDRLKHRVRVAQEGA